MTDGRVTRQRVTEVMQHPVPSVPAATPLNIALDMMIQMGTRHLVAVDPHGRCIGVLADQAGVSSWAYAGVKQTVQSVLDPHPAVIGSGAVVGQVARLMKATGATAVAVTDPQGLPVGIITGADLVALLSRDHEE